MNQIPIDANLASRLHEMTTIVELCDPSGKVVGRFLPQVDMSEWEPVTPDISEEELDERERSNEWCTTEEVLAYLKCLEKS